MKQIKWYSCGLSNAITRTVIHFFPSAGAVTAPYPALCRIGIFGAGIEPRWVTIEGARVSHPDGVRAEELFPELRQGINGFYGLTVEVSTNQPTADLSGSQCVIEYASKGQGLKFHALPWLEAKREFQRVENKVSEVENKPEFSGFLGLDDEQTISSVVLINSSEESWKPELLAPSTERSYAPIMPSEVEVPPRTTHEVQLGAELYSGTEPWSSSVGALRARAFYCSRNPGKNNGAYAIFRDRVTKRPVSICAI